MEYVTLGKTGLKVSRLGFGGIPIQRISEEECKVFMKEVFASGINYIDTARGYTVSESFIGASIEGNRDKFILATKSMARDKEGMAKDIEISLTNLRTNYIDLYQVHNPSLAQLELVMNENGALEALIEAKKAGKIGHIGLTAHSLEVFEKALDLDWVETIMFPYNIVETQGEACIQKCLEKNIGFIAMKPMAGGAIENGALALRYILNNQACTIAIPGMATVEELYENVEATNALSSLTDKEKEEIQKIKNDLGNNFCRRCNYCAPCSVGINIPSVFLFAGYLERYGLAEWAKDRYSTLAKKASDCIECGLCETKCPYQLPIRQMLKRCADEFGV